jgi:diaminopimelate decarboxylase
VLTFDGYNLASLAKERGTPLWVISRTMVESNFRELTAAFRARYPRCEFAYSIKAHNTLAVVRTLYAAGAKLDCSAEYEFQLALRAGVAPRDIILNGNGKSEEALRSAVELGVRQVNVDSADEVERLQAMANASGQTLPCVVRVQLAYKRLLELDPSFATTLRIGEGKFGSNVANGQALETIRAVLVAPNLQFVGLSHHVGFSGYMGDYSPERELMHHRECTREICEFANALQASEGCEVERLDLGGGFRSGDGVLLSTPGSGTDVAFHPLPTPAEYAEAIFGTLEEAFAASELPLVQFETGGYQIANAVLMLVTVSEVKDVPGPTPRRFVVVDGSMMMFVSRGMMRVGHPIVPVSEPLADAADAWPVEVVGQTCVYDSVAEDIRLPPVKRGDVLALLNQGAYCETESTQFNGFPRPEVVMLDRGQAYVVKRRETIEDIHARDRIPDDLLAGLPEHRPVSTSNVGGR